MSDLGYAFVFTLFGTFFLVHCARATIKEMKSGRALAGQFGDYDRETSPIVFWLVIAGNALAALLGAGLLVVGLVGMLAKAGLVT